MQACKHDELLVKLLLKRLATLLLTFLTLQSVQVVALAATGMREIYSGDIARSFWFHVPALETNALMPLVILLHPSGSNGNRMVNLGGYLGHAKANGYAIVAPNAINGEFNTGGRRADNRTVIDDVLFIEDIVATMSTDHRIDARRIYLIGFSSGATMLLRVAIESSFKFAGLAAVAGLPPMVLPDKLNPTPTVFIFGDSDPQYPLQGIENTDGWLQYPPEMAFGKWAKKMKCSISVSSTIKFVRHTKRSGCRNGVSAVYIQVGSLGHHWPKPRRSDLPVLFNPRKGPYQSRLDATTVIWDFFSKELARQKKRQARQNQAGDKNITLKKRSSP